MSYLNHIHSINFFIKNIATENVIFHGLNYPKLFQNVTAYRFYIKWIWYFQQLVSLFLCMHCKIVFSVLPWSKYVYFKKISWNKLILLNINYVLVNPVDIIRWMPMVMKKMNIKLFIDKQTLKNILCFFSTYTL